MHMVAYQASLNEAGALTYVTPVPDPSVRVQGNDIVVPQPVQQIIGAEAFLGANGAFGMLLSPSLRRISPYKISPIQAGIVPGTVNRRYMHPMSPIKLDYNEALDAQSQATPGAAEVHTILVHLADAAPAVTNGNVVKVRFTVTTLVTQGQWVNAPITFPNLLPTGTYAVVGASLVAAGVVAARWYPVGGQWRPGFPVMQAAGSQEDEMFRNGALGTWFTFDEVQPPTIDLLASASAGAATYEGVLDVIKTN
jgi:hypothetical protein